MNKVKEKPNSLFEWVKKWKWWIFHTIIILIMLIIAALGTWDAYHCRHLIGGGRPITLEYLVGFLVTITTIYIFVWRVRYQEKQINIQIKKEVDDRFTTAVNLLGSSETSARTGAIYSLYQQAVEDKKYRKQIVQILCSHIRSKTQEQKYQKQHKDRPSNEIQTTIDLLFRGTGNKGLYSRFKEEFFDADLTYAYCAGANFEKAYCERVNFFRANCQRVNFRESNCQVTDFGESHCQEANFFRTNCRGADFGRAYCQRTNFDGANCRGANFLGTHCQETNFGGAHCQGANFTMAYCQGTSFVMAYCRGASFWGAHCQGTDFWIAHCQGANFWGVQCQGANFEDAACQGAYNNSSMNQLLGDRIGKNTELEEPVLEGVLSEHVIDIIEKAKPYCSPQWYIKMQKIIEVNKDKEIKRGIPADIIPGVLKDSDGELQKLIKELKDIRESKERDAI